MHAAQAVRGPGRRPAPLSRRCRSGRGRRPPVTVKVPPDSATPPRPADSAAGHPAGTVRPSTCPAAAAPRPRPATGPAAGSRRRSRDVVEGGACRTAGAAPISMLPGADLAALGRVRRGDEQPDLGGRRQGGHSTVPTWVHVAPSPDSSAGDRGAGAGQPEPARRRPRLPVTSVSKLPLQPDAVAGRDHQRRVRRAAAVPALTMIPAFAHSWLVSCWVATPGDHRSVAGQRPVHEVECPIVCGPSVWEVLLLERDSSDISTVRTTVATSASAVLRTDLSFVHSARTAGRSVPAVSAGAGHAPPPVAAA